MIKRSVLLLGMLVLIPSSARAQFGSGAVVDRLIALVGDSVIVQSQIQEELQRMKLGGRPVPEPGDPGYDTVFREVLGDFIDQLLILQAAARDSLILPDEEILDERVNEQIAQLAQQFGGQPALQVALAEEALTLGEYREILKTEAGTQQLQQMYYQRHLRDAPVEVVTEDELLASYEEARGQLEQRPKLITFRQVVVAPEPSEEAVEAAREEAQALLDRINAGEDFAELAREHSDDPGSGALGGDLGWFRRGKMVREFEDAAFKLFEDQVSDLVKTDFGFHIIKVERYRAGERQARHILIIPEKTEADIERARSVANDVLVRARAGESMTDLFDEYSDPAAQDSLTFAFEDLGQLPPVYGVLRTASAGNFLGPLEYELSPGERRISIIHLIEVREAGIYTFEDLRAQLAARLQQEKQRERLIEALRARTHIEIRM